MTDINKQIEEASWDYLNPDDGDIIDFNDQAKLESFKQGAQWMLKKLERSSRWRKVSEGLPDVLTDVLIKSSNGKVDVGCLLDNKSWGMSSDFGDSKIEFWKPID